MYETFYHLQHNPFSLAPDPHFCFNHTGHQQAREYLEYALKLGEGIVMITGNPGTGKTTLVESFIDKLNTGSVMAAHIAVSRLDSNDLLRAVAYAFDIEAEGHDKATLRHLIKQYLEAQVRRGRRVLLIIDEAQGLPLSALEELRLLADLRSESVQMLQLFLVGQEQIHERMQDPEMDYFQQRVIAHYHLVPLDLQETRSYIEYRLRQAGWQGAPEFTGTAVLEIFRFSKGVPRHINKLCNRLLLLGYGTGSQSLDREQVQSIIEEMGEEQLNPVAAEPPARETGTGTPDETALQHDLMSELAIRIDEPPEPAFKQATNEPAEETLQTDELPLPAIVRKATRSSATSRLQVHSWNKGLPASGTWKNMLESSLIFVTVAVLTFTAIEGVIDYNFAQRLALFMGEQEQLFSAERISDQQAGLTVTIVEELEQSITGTEYTLLQRILNNELPATAVGRQLSGAATPSDALPDSPLEEVRSFVSEAEYIDYLLARGQQALVEDRLLTPALNSAYYYFQGALRISSENRDAANGIEQIIERYVELTNKALNEQDSIMANRYIARGLSIQPDNSELLLLKEKSSEPVIGQSSEENNPPSHQTINQLLSRIKTFFITASTAQPDDNASYQMTSSIFYE